MVKRIVKTESKFASVFIKDSDEKWYNEIKFLKEYLTYSNDEYMETILFQLKTHGKISGLDVERLHDLMQNVNLEELYVSYLLEGEEKLGKKSSIFAEASPGVSAQIREIMNRKDKLGDWDRKFVLGETGTALLDQCMARGGWLSAKQMKQIDRIEKNLGIKK